ncbi:hypothetical protein ACFUJR_27830 [Streptomyces sp. NPDC057271]|uniref:hypothetical protein n=1 Tax=unclassified Streptomyces TaxID=2593676 RepID=UPI0036347D5E
MTFEYRDHYGRRLILGPGSDLDDNPVVEFWSHGEYGVSIPVRVPLDLLEEVIAGARDARRQAAGQEAAACGLAHYADPETVCTEPTSHDGPHAGPYLVDGKQAGGAAWDQPGADPTTDDELRFLGSLRGAMHKSAEEAVAAILARRAERQEHAPAAPFPRGFRLHVRHGQVLDGALLPSGRCLVVDDPEDGLITAAPSIEDLLRGYPDSRIEWPPDTRDAT